MGDFDHGAARDDEGREDTWVCLPVQGYVRDLLVIEIETNTPLSVRRHADGILPKWSIYVGLQLMTTFESMRTSVCD